MKHPDCEERCQIAEHKGYQPCPGFCALADSERTTDESIRSEPSPSTSEIEMKVGIVVKRTREQQMDTYTEAQYSTPSAMKMIREQFLGSRRDDESIEATAVYMSKTLRIGGIKVCRALVMGAIEGDDEEPFANGPDTKF